MRNILTIALLLFASIFCTAQDYWMNTFETVDIGGKDTFWNGADESGGFLLNEVFYENTYNTTWKSWTGFSVSSKFDSSQAGFGNQFSAFNKWGVNQSHQFLVGNGSPTIRINKKQAIRGMYVCNSTYAALSMKNGDQFTKKFGGTTGNDPDFFLLKIFGYDGSVIDSTSIYLADFRFTDNSKDFILDQWIWVDLSVFGDVDSIKFVLSSSDNGQFGMNTPAFFCVDNFNAPDQLAEGYSNGVLFEPVSIPTNGYLNGSINNGGFLLNDLMFQNTYNPTWKSWSGFSISNIDDTTDGTFANQYAVCVSEKNNTYLVANGQPQVAFPFTKSSTKIVQKKIYVNNTNYVYKTLLNGNQFSKKMGGASGADPDFFKVLASATYYDGSISDTLEFFLADYRFSDGKKDYLVKEWTEFHLGSILPIGRSVSNLNFWFEGSDTGQYGLNTPAYACFDNFFINQVNVNEIKKRRLSIYPNPVSDFLYFDKSIKAEKIELTDLSGKVILQYEAPINNNHITLAELKPGVYFLEIESKGKIYTAKCVKN